jgi:hypothetical protein
VPLPYSRCRSAADPRVQLFHAQVAHEHYGMDYIVFRPHNVYVSMPVHPVVHRTIGTQGQHACNAARCMLQPAACSMQRCMLHAACCMLHATQRVLRIGWCGNHSSTHSALLWLGTVRTRT